MIPTPDPRSRSSSNITMRRARARRSRRSSCESSPEDPVPRNSRFTPDPARRAPKELGWRRYVGNIILAILSLSLILGTCLVARQYQHNPAIGEETIQPVPTQSEDRGASFEWGGQTLEQLSAAAKEELERVTGCNELTMTTESGRCFSFRRGSLPRMRCVDADGTDSSGYYADTSSECEAENRNAFVAEVSFDDASEIFGNIKQLQAEHERIEGDPSKCTASLYIYTDETATNGIWWHCQIQGSVGAGNYDDADKPYMLGWGLTRPLGATGWQLFTLKHPKKEGEGIYIATDSTVTVDYTLSPVALDGA